MTKEAAPAETQEEFAPIQLAGANVNEQRVAELSQVRK